MNLCKYSEIFGQVGKGIHSYRIFNLAIVDVIFTILTAFLISEYYKYNLLIVLIVLFILSIILHKLFCVKTTLTMIFFPILTMLTKMIIYIPIAFLIYIVFLF